MILFLYKMIETKNNHFSILINHLDLKKLHLLIIYVLDPTTIPILCYAFQALHGLFFGNETS